ncbi:MAG: hormogonium polysaccharide biosynthesis protein HpsA [Trichormus sp. ATA11-4-KO1]|jgi:hypothetical protein|nr:hormogonium polysaccharide biosynthesis protein HpsA [Trichormus sp. ATA11-4-KO1]
MSLNRQLVKTITKIAKQFSRISRNCGSAINNKIIWLLRTLFVSKRRKTSANAGFVLPTVAMVSIVVVLLTTAILFRSFERSKNASNVRVNEVVLKAAAPAMDRAKAKINQLFQDPRLPRSTPSDLSLSQVIEGNINQFTFGDETQLKVVKDFNGTTGIQEEEILNTAWKYPVDTDNDGKFDSYTIYGIYFRTPTSTRARSPLEARVQPMDEGAFGSQCQSDIATSANLVSSQGWYKVGSKLKRSIFIHTATVPITNIAGLDDTKYEKFTGNRGFAALEYQQDRERIPLANNAVIYEDDLEISPGAGLNLNGRVFTNGNLLTRSGGTAIRFYLVSSPKSCYYTEENSKIVVAGNVINSRVNETSSGNDVRVDLFDKDYDVDALTLSSANISNTNKTVPTAIHGSTAAYNDEAYAKRIDRLVQATITTYSDNTDLPEEVQEEIQRDLAVNPTKDPNEVRQEQLTVYFRKRTRRVPFAEIPFGSDALHRTGGTNYNTTSPLAGSGNSLRPVDAWVFPFAPGDGTTATDYAEIGIKTNGGNKIYLSATDPAIQATAGKEDRLGDRVLVGNNMPELWYDGSKFVSSPGEGQTISGRQWDNNTNTRKRFSQAYQLDNLGVTNRNGFWEQSAAQKPNGTLDVVGGLRVVTGAGIYLPNNRNPGSTTTDLNADLAVTDKIWPDNMPMGITNAAQGLPSDQTPYLKMRATAVYHYQDDFYDPKTPTDYQAPIACVSSFYDPTTQTTADASNNGTAYPASSLAITGYEAVLNYQKDLKYPNGRWVNKPLRDALANINATPAKSLTLSQQSAVDSAMCALKILDGTIGTATETAVPHNAIKETAFLDARQIKAIDRVYGSKNYDLDVELRQPLEIRATVLDLDLLRKKSKTGGEFLFPNSGIIYATRDDALPDESDTSKYVSETDFTLDPTRRPNGIMLINGSDLSRNATYKAEEKGLILASDLPVYIEGDFNKHTKEEFTELNTWGDDFYKRKTLDPNFACRKDQFSSCNTGETWRPASILADAITVLSDNFKRGFRRDGDYDLNDNYGSYPIGYDLNGDGNVETTLSATTPNTLDERVIKIDLNNDGDKDDATVNIIESNITSTIATRINGFWDNNFVTSRDFIDGQYSGSTAGRVDSSYFNNFVTPVQRRGSFPEYVMEICRKPTVTACKPGDWSVGYETGGTVDWSYKAIDSGTNRILPNDTDYTVDKLGAGTTARPALNAADRHFPRRVAFLRDATSGNLIFSSSNRPIPLGIIGGNNNITNATTLATENLGQVRYYPFDTHSVNGVSFSAYSSSNKPRRHYKALWFKTDNAGVANYGHDYPLWIENQAGLTATRKIDQPLLAPVLQIQYPFISPAADTTSLGTGGNAADPTTGFWMQHATATETNLVFAQGNTPARPPNSNIGESNGGLENFVRYLENWNGINHKASGSFIQFKRSSYTTAPWQTLIATGSPNGDIFGYPQIYRTSVTDGRSPFYNAPTRLWGYDVALLTQLPDLFSQRFTAPATNEPNEFFREVGRDDTWIKTLLCAAQKGGGYEEAPSTLYGDDFEYAISEDQRGNCS